MSRSIIFAWSDPDQGPRPSPTDWPDQSGGREKFSCLHLPLPRHFGTIMIRLPYVLSVQNAQAEVAMKKNRQVSKKDVIALIQAHRHLARKYTVRKIGLFGSFARNEQVPASDIDLYVEFGEPSFDNFMGFSTAMEELFDRKVDILTPAGVASIRNRRVKAEIRRSIAYV